MAQKKSIPVQPTPHDRSEFEELAAIHDYLSNKSQRFEGEYAKDAARNLTSTRTEALSRVDQPFRNMEVKSAGSGTGTTGPLADLQPLLEELRSKYYPSLSVHEVDRGNGRIDAIANFPFATEESRSKLLTALGNGKSIVVADGAHARRLARIFFAAMLRELVASIPAVDVRVDDYPPWVWSIYSKYETFAFIKQWRGKISDGAKEGQALVSALEQRSKDLGIEIESARKEVGVLENGRAKIEGEWQSFQAELQEVRIAIEDTKASEEKRISDWGRASKNASD